MGKYSPWRNLDNRNQHWETVITYLLLGYGEEDTPLLQIPAKNAEPNSTHEETPNANEDILQNN
jgi:hypothetical protein